MKNAVFLFCFPWDTAPFRDVSFLANRTLHLNESAAPACVGDGAWYYGTWIENEALFAQVRAWVKTSDHRQACYIGRVTCDTEGMDPSFAVRELVIRMNAWLQERNLMIVSVEEHAKRFDVKQEIGICTSSVNS